MRRKDTDFVPIKSIPKDIINTYIVYDYETYGLDVRKAGIAQLAAVKLDSSLNYIEENDFNYEVDIYKDQLISPIASIKTGFKITPIVDYQGNILDWDLVGRVRGRAKLSEPLLAYAWNEYLKENKNTCILGYNNFNFDDKVTSNLFFRNFINPYQWFYENGNTRVDLYPIAVAFANLCPKAINWPIDQTTGNISFKLEEITKANKFSHLNAHDAMSDVKACVQLLHAFNAPRLDNSLFSPEELQSLYNINFSPKACLKYLLNFRLRDTVTKYLEGKYKNSFVYFDVNARKRDTLHLTPVFCLNNLVDKAIEREAILLDLSIKHEDLVEFFSWNEQELGDFLSLSPRYRKFRSPALFVELNKFPLFAELKECSQNPLLSDAEFLDNYNTNVNYVLDLPTQVKIDLFNRLTQVGKNRFSGKVPDQTFSDKVYVPVQESEEVVYSNEQMLYKHQVKDKLLTLDNQIKIFPDTFLNKSFNTINNNREVFQGEFGLNFDRFNYQLAQISRDPILNNMFILFKGNADFYNLTAELKFDYLNKIEARLELSREEFDNGLVDLRRLYVEDREKFLQEYNLNEIQEINKNTLAYYDFIKSKIGQYRNELSNLDYEKPEQEENAQSTTEEEK
ncbi:hypothetical protein CJP74_06815 [Psittacicella melopsittaci]|uniref:Uncharacterized protein n=1 Tax=Psittacicella melopsittaci TaxID=2028576 RepID=A0A3A1Y2H0_9GAMM|nr:hypothetical protein [Psittacicella melopsittaci]RIY31631.1 hypothetical protein CJP74_06815 [Psittacicella melopsittaci]